MEGMLKLYSPINKLKQIGENIWIVDGNEINMSTQLSAHSDFRFRTGGKL